MRRLFAEGAFAQAFVPLIAEYKATRAKRPLTNWINRVATLQLVALLAVTLLGILAAPWLIPLFASGFDKTAGKARRSLPPSFADHVPLILLFISLLTALAGA